MSVFHVHDGWEFERQPDGSVRISAGDESSITLPAVEWASVITAVSPGGGTGVTFQAAKELHGGEA